MISINEHYGAFQATLIISIVKQSNCKGIAVIGASGGGNEVCADCGGNYTDEELKLSLIILLIIMVFFLIILCCQCLSRVYHFWNREDLNTNHYYEKHKSLPPPPYIRSISGV